MNYRLYVIFLLILVNVSHAEYVDIDSIEVKLSDDGNINNSKNRLTIDVGEDFYIHTLLKNPDKDGNNVRVYLRVYMRETLVYDRGKDIDTDEGVDYEIIISSDDFRTIWEKTFMAYNCRASNDIKVEVYGDVPNNVNSAELNIESEYDKHFDEVTILPPKPDKNDMIFIYVEDWVNESDDDDVEEGGEPLEDAFIKVTNYGEDQEWDSTDDFDVYETDNEGMVKLTISKQREFRYDPYGKYHIVILEKKEGDDYGEYCSYEHTFTIGRYINITINPETPKEEERITVEVIDDQNLSVPFVLLTVSSIKGLVLQTTTNENGKAIIQINDSGIHTISALREGCEDCANSVSKWFEVLSRGRLELDVYPEEVEVGKDIIIEVSTEEGAKVRGAKVTIIKPNGVVYNASATTSLGVSGYIPDEIGEYRVTVQKSGYKRVTEKFNAYNSFKVDIPDQLEIGREYKLIVRNQFGEAVPNATMILRGLQPKGDIYNKSFDFTPLMNKSCTVANISYISRINSDANGTINLSIDKGGFYRLNISKEGYRDLIKGVLMLKPLTVKLSSQKINLDKSITISSFDSEGNPLKSLMEINKPDRKVDRKETSVYEYKPMLSGDYSVTVSSREHLTKTLEFEVLPYAIDMTAEVVGNYLVISVRSNDLPLSKTKVEIITPDVKRIEAHTDDEGLVNLDLPALNRKGNYTIRVRKRNYETKEIEKEVLEWGGFDITQLILSIAGISVLIAALFVGYRYYEGRKIKRRLRRLRRGKRRT